MTRKQLVLTSLFLFLLVSILLIINESIKFFASKSCVYEQSKINTIMSHCIDSEVMVFGSSVAFVHFNDSLISKICGIKTFNAGTDGANYQQCSGLIEEFISYTNECKYLVLAFTVHDYTKRTAIYEITRYLPHISNSNVYKSLNQIDFTTTFKARYVPGYAFTMYNNSFYDLVKNGYANWKTDMQCKVNGWFPFPNKDFDSSAMIGITDSTFVLPVDEDILYDIIDLRERLRKKGIKLIIVLPPIEKGMLPKLHNLNEYREKLTDMAGDTSAFFDFTKSALINNRTLFYNYTHLTKEGAQLFSSEFAEKLKHYQFMNLNNK